MKKPIIAVDVDDVLSKTSQGFIEFSNKTWGHTLTQDDYDEDWAKVWGTSVKVARERADFMHENGIFGELSYFSEALAVLAKLKKHYTLVVATSRRATIESLSKAWLKRHYDGIFKGVFFSGIYDGKLGKHEDHVARTKNDLLLEIGADYLIDDQLKHCLAAGEHGVEAVLFGDYKWNQSHNLPAHVTRCVDWSAVEAYFVARSCPNFRQQVEELVAQIPCGRVMTYGQLAALCGNPQAARVVGGIAHFGDPALPWQRVVNKSGGLAAGYPGGRRAHAELLRAEGVNVSDTMHVDVAALIWWPPAAVGCVS